MEINLVNPSSLLNVIANYEIENILYYLILLEQLVCFTQGSILLTLAGSGENALTTYRYVRKKLNVSLPIACMCIHNPELLCTVV